MEKEASGGHVEWDGEWESRATEADRVRADSSLDEAAKSRRRGDRLVSQDLV